MARKEVGLPAYTQVPEPIQVYEAHGLVHIKKFVGTYFFSILLIISVAIVFDLNDNLPKFTENHAPLRAIVFDYYPNFVPYFANLFSALFVFIAVIFFYI